MIIRHEQMRVFEQIMARGFEERMLARVRLVFPKHPVMLGEEQLLLLVRLAVEKARKYTLTTERNVALFLDLMCLLGSGFDTDPQMPWAAEILADRSFVSDDERADALHERGWRFAQTVAGDFKDSVEKGDYSRLIAALKTIDRLGTEELTQDAAAQLAHELASNLKTAFPIRCATIGDACLTSVLDHAYQSASRYGIDNARAVSLFAALSLVVGAGFDTDPQLPWASRILRDPSTATDPISRSRRLHRGALQCLREWWDVGEGVDG